MKQIRQRLTYANVMSTIAVFFVIGGASALAATQLAKNSVGSKQLKKNAVVAAKIKNNAVTSAKIKNGAVTNGKLGGNSVTGDKLAAGSVTSGKIADGGVGALQLDANQRSEVVSTSTSSSFDFVDTYNPATWTTVQSVNLPNGSWVVHSHIGIAIGGSTTHVGCRMLQAGQVLSQTGTQGEVLGIIPSIDGLDLEAIASAGQVTVVCGDSNDGTTAINRSLIATRAGTVTAG